MLPGDRILLKLKRQKGYLLRNRYFNAIDSSSMRMVADMIRFSRGTNIEDLNDL